MFDSEGLTYTSNDQLFYHLIIQTLTCPKSTIETLEKGVKNVQSSNIRATSMSVGKQIIIKLFKH